MNALYVSNTLPRMYALLIDGLLVLLTYVPFYLTKRLRIEDNTLFLSWTSVAGTFAFSFVYQFYFLKKYSQTPGKRLFGLYVVDAKSQLPSLSSRQILLRLLGGLLSVPLNLAPQAFSLLRIDRRTIQDLIAGTQVLRNVPRQDPVKIRWVAGAVLTLYFAWSGMKEISNMRDYKFSSEGITADLRPRGDRN